jgi:two-component system response regulator DesR
VVAFEGMAEGVSRRVADVSRDYVQWLAGCTKMLIARKLERRGGCIKAGERRYWFGQRAPVGGVMIRVLVAEDMRILRDTLVSVLNLEADITVVAQVAAGTDIVPAALAERPDLAVLDIDLPGLDGITAAARLRARMPACRVVILTVLGRPGQLRAALDAHVAGFMVKDAPSDQLIDVLRKVAAGERVIDPKLALAALEMRESPLSERETDVLRRFAAGAELPAIAAELFLSYGTVRNYMASAVTKLGGRNRVDAVRIATDAGWL